MSFVSCCRVGPPVLHHPVPPFLLFLLSAPSTPLDLRTLHNSLVLQNLHTVSPLPACPPPTHTPAHTHTPHRFITFEESSVAAGLPPAACRSSTASGRKSKQQQPPVLPSPRSVPLPCTRNHTSHKHLHHPTHPYNMLTQLLLPLHTPTPLVHHLSGGGVCSSRIRCWQHAGAERQASQTEGSNSQGLSTNPLCLLPSLPSFLPPLPPQPPNPATSPTARHTHLTCSPPPLPPPTQVYHLSGGVLCSSRVCRRQHARAQRQARGSQSGNTQGLGPSGQTDCTRPAYISLIPRILT